ncbi:MAG: hypothetical protein OHK0012_24830 [Synechococcales cyanobacterium]
MPVGLHTSPTIRPKNFPETLSNFLLAVIVLVYVGMLSNLHFQCVTILLSIKV